MLADVPGSGIGSYLFLSGNDHLRNAIREWSAKHEPRSKGRNSVSLHYRLGRLRGIGKPATSHTWQKIGSGTVFWRDQVSSKLLSLRENLIRRFSEKVGCFPLDHTSRAD